MRRWDSSIAAFRTSGPKRDLAVVALVALLTLACTTSPPLSVKRSRGDVSRRILTSNVVNTGELSESTKIVLRRHELMQLPLDGDGGAIALLHADVASRLAGSDEYFALAELSFYRAEALALEAYRRARWRDERFRRGARRRPPPYKKSDWAIVDRAKQRYLAAAIYAFTFIFTNDEVGRVSVVDPRLRTSVDIYNRAIALAFQNEGGFTKFASGELEVPFGVVDVTFDEADRVWGNRRLVDFIPADEFIVTGLRNRYRRPGLGAPLAAHTRAIDDSDPAAYLVAKNAVVSTTAFMLVPDPRVQLEGKRVFVQLRLEPWSEQETIEFGEFRVPLEAQPSAALAASLEESDVWQSSFGVFLGRIARTDTENRLFGWEPRLPGQIPVVFIHGTMSSPVIWANMVNDLQSDPLIRDRYQFLFYAYESGNPILYSSMILRRALYGAVDALDPAGQDACLREMVLVGHSQGGLLAKTQVISSGSAIWDSGFDVPLEKTWYSKRSKKMLREAAYFEPDPFVDRVVFISTPHRGSHVAASRILRTLAARAIRFPGDLTSLAAETAGVETVDENYRHLRLTTSIDNMSPNNEMIQTLASIPIEFPVHVNSIISVKGNGPVEEGDDGVVKYVSAHIDEAESELVVDVGHSSYGHPRTIEEMRRILRMHAETVACEAP